MIMEMELKKMKEINIVSNRNKDNERIRAVKGNNGKMKTEKKTENRIS